MISEESKNTLDAISNFKNGFEFKDKPIISIVKIETYGFESAVFSATDEDLNKEIFKAGQQKNPTFGKTGVPVGYIIHNSSSTPIENVIIPEYDLHTSPYSGKHKTVTLPPNNYMRIPTKYLILLLMRLGCGLNCANGKFVKIKDDLQTDDYDVKMMNYMFEPDKYWDEYFTMTNLEALEPVGYFVQRGDKFCGLEILQDYFVKIYGYIENIKKNGYSQTVEKEETREALETSTFLAALYNPEK